MRSYLAVANLVALVTPVALLACGGAPASDGTTTESSAVMAANCPPGETWQCTNEGPGGRRICQCVETGTPVTFSGTVSNLAAGQTLVIAGQGAFGGQYVTTPDSITQSGSFSFQGQPGETSMFVMTQPANQVCDMVPVSNTSANFNCGNGATLQIYVVGHDGLVAETVPGVQVTVTGGGATARITTNAQSTGPYDVSFLATDTVTVSVTPPNGWYCSLQTPSTFPMSTTSSFNIDCHQ
jgi:hypothetical protein